MGVVRSLYTEEVGTIQGEFAGISVNSNGDLSLKLYVDRNSRVAASELADSAGYMMEFRVYRKPRVRTAHYNKLDLPDAVVPGD